jgi:O-antigen/teichoic acid export membrane protein
MRVKLQLIKSFEWLFLLINQPLPLYFANINALPFVYKIKTISTIVPLYRVSFTTIYDNFQLSVLKKLASQSAWYGLSSIIGRALFFLLTPFYTRTFVDAQSFGLMSYVYAYIAFANVIYTYGLETGFFYFSERHSGQKVYGNATSSIFISTTVFTILIIAFCQPIAQFMKLQQHPEFVWYAAAILALEALSVMPFALLRMQQKSRKFALIKLVGIAINIGLNLFFLWLCPLILAQQDVGAAWLHTIYSPDIGVGYVFIANIISSTAVLFMLQSEIRQCKWQLDLHLLKQMLVYALPLLVAGLAGMINETLDRIILSYVITDTNEALRQQGIYGAVYKLAMLMTMFVQAYRFAAEPYFFCPSERCRCKTSLCLCNALLCIGLLVIVSGGDVISRCI